MPSAKSKTSRGDYAGVAWLRRRPATDAIGLGAPEPEQTIEQRTAEKDFRRLAGKRARREPVPEGALPAGNRRLAQAPPMIAHGHLPATPAHAANAPQVLIAIERRAPTVPVLFD